LSNGAVDAKAYEAMLRCLVRSFVTCDLNLDEFLERYRTLFLEVVPQNALPDDVDAIYGEGLEVTEWTAENPSSEDRAWGWHTVEETREWWKRALGLPDGPPSERRI
jgi:hypothetical protein